MNVDNLSTLDTPVDLAPSFFLPGAISKPDEAHEPRQSDQPDHFHDNTASMRRRTNIVLPTVIVVLFACSDDTEPRAVAPEPCHAQPVYEQAALDYATEQDVRVALLDAAERLAPGLAEGERAAELRAALRSIQTSGADASDAACRAIHIARELLETQPDVAESRPDREAIRLALDLAETYYAGAR